MYLNAFTLPLTFMVNNWDTDRICCLYDIGNKGQGPYYTLFDIFRSAQPSIDPILVSSLAII